MERELFKSKEKLLVINAKLLEVLQGHINLNEVIILQQIDYWTELAKQEKKNFINGKYWYFSSVQKMYERNFKFCFSIETLRRSLKLLEENNFLITIKKFNAKYYRVNYKEINKYFNIFEKENKKNDEKESLVKMTKRFSQNDQTIKEINKEINKEIIYIDLSKKKIRLKKIADKFILKKIKKQEISKKSTQKTAKNSKNEKLDHEFKTQMPKLDVLRYELGVSEDFASKLYQK